MRALPIVTAAMLICTPAFTKIKPFNPPKSILPITELNIELTASQIMAGEFLDPDIIFKCEAGTTIPLNFLYKRDFFSVAIDPKCVIKIEETTFVRFIKKKVYFSKDLVHWNKHIPGGSETIKIKRDTDKVTLEITNTPFPDSDFDDVN